MGKGCEGSGTQGKPQRTVLVDSIVKPINILLPKRGPTVFSRDYFSCLERRAVRGDKSTKVRPETSSVVKNLSLSLFAFSDDAAFYSLGE